MATGGALGRLSVVLGLDSAEFTRGLNRSEYQAKKSFDKMDADLKRLAATFATVGLAAGAAAVAWTKRTAEAAKEIDRFANLSNASAETFQRWTYGARTVGIEQEKLADILKDVQDRVGDFITTGGGPMADFFENIASKVGVTAEQFRRLSGPEALGLFVSSLEKAGLSQSEVIFYMEAMASDSSLLVPLLKDNAQQMGILGDEAQSLGMVLRDDTIVQAREFHENLDKIKGMASGAANSIFEEMIPALTSLSGQFIEASKAGNGFFASIRGMALGIGQSTEPMALFKEMDRLIGQIEAIEQMRASLSPAAAAAHAADFEKSLGPLQARLEIVKQLIQDVNPKDAWEKPPVTILPEVEVRPDKKDSKGRSRSSRIPDPLGDFINDQERAFNEYQSFIDQVTGRADMARLDQQTKWLEYASSIGAITGQEFERGIESLYPVVEDATGAMDQFAVQAARNIESALGDGLYNILKGDFDNIGAAFGDMLLRMAAEAQAAQLAKAMLGDYGSSGQIGGLIGNVVSGLFGPTGVADASAIQQAGGDGIGYLIGVNRWDRGGFTGPGGKYEPAGIVHRGEYVLTKEATSRIGVGALDRMNKGYANGGLVGGGPAATSSGAPVVNIINNSSQPLTASQPKVSMDDMGRMVIEVMLADWRRNGPYAQQLRSPR